ncbi:MAG: hypothetical protein K0Q77_1222 [Anaerosporomusa subterranea]|jgi:uncharacterized membrane protein|nr:hypothetical protein [Anaerosporomusa subterranea]
MNKKALAELYQDLPELITTGVLTPEAAENIKNHYGPIEDNQGRPTFLLAFGVFGVLLVGLGITLLIAHNWAQLTRVNRLALSIGLLVAAQLVAGMTLYFKQESRTWRESAAALHMIVIGAVLALVGQTYHLTGDTDSFLLTWMLLSLPLMYLLRANSVAVLYLLGVTYWSASIYSPVEKQFVWLLLALALPYYWRQMRQDRFSNTTAVLSWVWNICLYGCFTAAFDSSLNTFRALVYSALFSINYMAGVLWFNTVQESRLPFKAIGLAGSGITIFILTFYDYWRHLNMTTSRVSSVETLLVIALLLLTAVALFRTAKQTGHRNLPFAVAPLVISIGYLVQYFDASGSTAMILLNGYMLLLSIWVISAGSRNRSIGQVNAGMLMLALLIAARFLDANLSFVIRGVVFVCLGIGFLVVNWLMVRHKAGGQHEK